MEGDLVGRRLGKYEIRAEIGRGGMGTVYLAFDPLLQRRVAIKVLAPHLAWQPGLIERFQREARAAATTSACCRRTPARVTRRCAAGGSTR